MATVLALPRPAHELELALLLNRHTDAMDRHALAKATGDQYRQEDTLDEAQAASSALFDVMQAMVGGVPLIKLLAAL